jgi:hypothetical protein
MCVCKGCAFEYEWKQSDTSVPDECRGCQVVDGKPTNFINKSMTNADRIRAMTDEELKEFLCSFTKCEVCQFEAWGGCELLKWLQQPAEENKHGTNY